MPRNDQGVYTLPAGNPVVSSTTITSPWANSTMPDIGSEITASLPRNGSAGMTGPLILARDAILPFEAVPLQQFTSIVGTIEDITDECEGYRDESKEYSENAAQSELNSENSAQDSANCRQESYDNAQLTAADVIITNANVVSTNEDADRAEAAADSIDLDDVTVSLPVVTLDAETGTTGFTISRASTQDYTTPSGDTETMGEDQLLATYTNGRKAFEIGEAGEFGTAATNVTKDISKEFNPSECTLIVECETPVLSGDSEYIFSIGDGSANRLLLFRDSSDRFKFTSIDGASNDNVRNDTVLAGGIHKIAVSMISGESLRMSIDGGAVLETVTTNSLSGNIGALFVGSTEAGTSYLNGSIYNLTYEPKAYTDDELQKASTPTPTTDITVQEINDRVDRLTGTVDELARLGWVHIINGIFGDLSTIDISSDGWSFDNFSSILFCGYVYNSGIKTYCSVEIPIEVYNDIITDSAYFVLHETVAAGSSSAFSLLRVVPQDSVSVDVSAGATTWAAGAVTDIYGRLK